MYNNYVIIITPQETVDNMTTVAKHFLQRMNHPRFESNLYSYVFIMIERCPRLPTHTHKHAQVPVGC